LTRVRTGIRRLCVVRFITASLLLALALCAFSQAAVGPAKGTPPRLPKGASTPKLYKDGKVGPSDLKTRPSGGAVAGVHSYVGENRPMGRNWRSRDDLLSGWSEFSGQPARPLSTPTLKDLTSPALATPDPDMISDDIHPRWSKNKMLIALATNASGTRQGLAADHVTQVTYLIGNTGDYYHIWTMDREGRNLTRVTSGSGDERWPEISPQNNMIAYAGRAGLLGKYNIYIKDLVTSEVLRLTDETQYDCIEPTWSPSGQWIAFARFDGSQYKIWKIRTDGSGLTQLTSSSDFQPGSDRNPTWSPDGQKIAYDRDTGASHRVWIMDSDGDNQTQWTNFSVLGEKSIDKEPFYVAADPAHGLQEVLFFASTRKDTDGDDVADGLYPTDDIYRIFTSSAEGGGNQPYAVNTNDAEDDKPTGAVQKTEGPTGGVWTDYSAFSSDRLAPDGYDRGRDVWLAIPEIDVEDGDPPTLDALPTVTPRLAIPGSEVRIEADVSDSISGVDRVWVQFKDPDDQFQDAEGDNHKLYMLAFYQAINVTDNCTWFYLEVGCQAIDPSAYTYHDPFVLDYWMVGVDPDQTPANALELYDDGSHGDTVAGDGLYTNTWQTPSEPSDFYLDVIVRDKQHNLMVYDNTYGFTTQDFEGAQSILVVSDYAQGQWFVSPRTELATFQFVPTESYFTFNPTYLVTPSDQLYDCTTGLPLDPAVPIVAQSPLGNDGYSYEGSKVGGRPYDIWRTQCRGRVPTHVLDSYLAYFAQEPDPNAPTSWRTKSVYERCVMWFAPYAGDLWVAPGTIIDFVTQQNLTQFLDTGGRLLVSGQDVAWALTLDGSTNSVFLTNYLGAEYYSDSRTAYDLYADTTSTGLFPAEHPISHNPVNPNLDPGDPTNAAFGLAGYAYLPWTAGTIYAVLFHGMAGALCTGFPDAVLPTEDAYEEYDYVQNAEPYGFILTQDGVTGSKTAYASFGIEGVADELNVDNSIAYSENSRQGLIHNTASWMRQGRITGEVMHFDNDQGKFVPLQGALVLAYYNNTSVVGGTALTGYDGSYQIVGLDTYPYALTAYKPGYLIEHPGAGALVEGPWTTDDVRLLMTKAQPGWIEGTVVNDNQEGVAGVELTATERLFGEMSFTGVTDAEGNYTIDGVAVGDYIVTITSLPAQYGSFDPPSYGDPDDPDSERPIPLTVASGNAVSGIDFTVMRGGGTVSGVVTDAVSGLPVYPATIQVLLGSDVLATATTDESGFYETDEVPGATVTVRCSAPGYQTTSEGGVVVPSGDTIEVNFELAPLPPGSLSGLITVAGTGEAVGSGEAQIRLKVDDVTVLGPISTIDPVTDAGYTYNYKFDSVPPATYTVEVTAQDYSVDPRSGVAVSSGVETRSINFVLEPLHLFGAGLTLISTPYDYEAFLNASPPLDAEDLLNLSEGQLRMAAWNAEQYVMYPDPGAETFRLGAGYFIYLMEAAPLLKQGDPAQEGVPYEIPLAAGWSMIGAPFTAAVIWSHVMVQVGGQAPMTMQEAVDAGVIRAGLWAYPGFGSQYQLSTSLEAWKGYWVKATQVCRLIIDPTRAMQSEDEAEAQRSRQPSRRTTDDGWRLQLVASSGSLVDSSNEIGVSAQAKDAYDTRGDIEEPPQVTGAAYLRLSFPHDDWGTDSGRYAHDVRSSGSNEQVWRFTVDTNLREAACKITWPEITRLPRGVSLVLVDELSGKRTFMRSASSYTFTAGGDRAARSFRIEAQPAGEGSLMICGVASSPVRGGSPGAISFALTKDASVDVRILSLTGKPIRQLARGMAVMGKSGQVVWDGRAAEGGLVPNGVYIVEIRARTAEGEQARAVQNMVVGR
jgi:hypothetical protein